MRSIRALRKSELSGTCYIELLPGRFANKHWSSDSIYFDDEVFGLLEKIIRKHCDYYDHYGMNNVSGDQWNLIISDFENIINRIESNADFNEIEGLLGFYFSDTRDKFLQEYDSGKLELKSVLEFLIKWVKEKLQLADCIAILGI